MTTYRNGRKDTGGLRGRHARLGFLTAFVMALSLLAPVTASAQGSSCTRESRWPEPKLEWAADVIGLTNAHRLTLGLAPLAPSDTLTTAAAWKAAHMAYFGYFGHDDPASPTRTWDQRIRDCGYSYGAGENIAYGYRSPWDVLQGWLGSPGHRKNIENPDYQVIGVGAVVADNGRPYWVQNFGTRADAGATQPAGTQPAPPPPVPTTSPVGGEAPAPTTPAPVAKGDSVTVGEDESVRLDPTVNDFVTLGDRLDVVYHEDPAHGTITREGNGLTYRPDADFAGTDSFHYWVSDQFKRTCGARITVTVEPVNDAPVATADRIAVRPRSRVFVRVVANDIDVDGDRIALEGIEGTPRFGSATVNATDGVIAYRPRRGTKGRNEAITYLVSDGNGGSAYGKLRIRIRR